MSERESARYHIYNFIFNLIAWLTATRAENAGPTAIRANFTNSRRLYIVANSKYNKRRWSVPSKRAKGYAADRKAKVHTYGPKEGKELTDFEAGIRSGYLQAQSDHAGLYKYKKALDEGKSKKEAREISQTKGRK